jgi:large subunit ribosomal protein L4
MAIEVNIYNLDGKQETEKIKLNEKVFGTRINRALLHDYVLWYQANARSGSANTKTRGEVRGGGKKPYPQKHTGNARRGSTRSPLIVGGGVSFGPKPRSFEFNFTKNMKKAALRSALSNRAEKMVVLKVLELKQPKTKEMAKVVTNFALKDSALFIDADVQENVVKASRNIKYVKVVDTEHVNPYDLLKYKNVFFTVNAVKKLEEKLA